MAVGCLEPKFFAVFVERFIKALPQDFLESNRGWTPALRQQYDRSEWPTMRYFLEKAFKVHGRGYWENIFEGACSHMQCSILFDSELWFVGTDACTFPVLTPLEASKLDPSRSLTPAPHPILSRTPSVPLERSAKGQPLGLKRAGEDTEQILGELGLGEDEKRRLRTDGALGKVDRVGSKL